MHALARLNFKLRPVRDELVGARAAHHLGEAAHAAPDAAPDAARIVIVNVSQIFLLLFVVVDVFHF